MRYATAILRAILMALLLVYLLTTATQHLRHKNSVLNVEEGSGEMAGEYDFEIKVRKLAYELWEQAHKPPGGQEQHFWHEAEKQLREEQAKEEQAKEQPPKK